MQRFVVLICRGLLVVASILLGVVACLFQLLVCGDAAFLQPAPSRVYQSYADSNGQKALWAWYTSFAFQHAARSIVHLTSIACFLHSVSYFALRWSGSPPLHRWIIAYFAFCAIANCTTTAVFAARAMECIGNVSTRLGVVINTVLSIAKHIMLHSVMLQKLKSVELAGPLDIRGCWCLAYAHQPSALKRFFQVEILCIVVAFAFTLVLSLSGIPNQAIFYIAAPLLLAFLVGELMFSITSCVVLRDMMASIERDSSESTTQIKNALVVVRRHLAAIVLALGTGGCCYVFTFLLFMVFDIIWESGVTFLVFLPMWASCVDSLTNDVCIMILHGSQIRAEIASELFGTMGIGAALSKQRVACKELGARVDGTVHLVGDDGGQYRITNVSGSAADMLGLRTTDFVLGRVGRVILFEEMVPSANTESLSRFLSSAPLLPEKPVFLDVRLRGRRVLLCASALSVQTSRKLIVSIVFNDAGVVQQWNEQAQSTLIGRSSPRPASSSHSSTSSSPRSSSQVQLPAPRTWVYRGEGTFVVVSASHQDLPPPLHELEGREDPEVVGHMSL